MGSKSIDERVAEFNQWLKDVSKAINEPRSKIEASERTPVYETHVPEHAQKELEALKER